MQDIDPHTPFDSITDKLIAQLRQPFTLPCLQNSISCSIGISIYPRTSQTIDQLLNHADCAMYQAKQQGLDLQIFSPKPR
ncbi:MAG: diguanylate cyclase [Desulfuromonas thiophila]|nr:diguanylate cyclase [Desulfuromonas thiophila]